MYDRIGLFDDLEIGVEKDLPLHAYQTGDNGTELAIEPCVLANDMCMMSEMFYMLTRVACGWI